ncbi:MAG: M14 family metallopeptidase [Clostridia bacterium]
MFKPNNYYKYDEIINLLKYWESNFSNNFSYEKIGESYENRDIFVTIITKDINDYMEKPAYYIDANHHAGEVTGSATALYTINYLLNNQDDEKVEYLLNNYTFYIVPRIAVDGSEFYLTTPHSLRSSPREYSPALEKGLMQQDVDDNGQILQMRFKSKTGSYKISDKDPRVMVKRQPDDIEGDFYEVVTEGLIENFDGVEIKKERTKWGLDYNRNYPHGWNPEHIQKGAGPYPLSEKETRSIANFILNHQNIAGAMSYHTYGGVILRPYCTKDDKEMNKDDLKFFKELGEIGENLTNYPCWSIFEKFTLDKSNPSAGSFIDFTYDYLGITCFATELWDIRARAGLKKITFQERLEQTIKEKEKDELELLKYNDENFNGKLFIDWYEFDHPQLGKVELGGWNRKFSFQNPPVNLLEEVCHKNMMFTFSHALSMPKLDIEVVKVEKINSNIYKVDCAIINRGSLNTSGSQLAKNLDKYKKIEIKLEGDIENINDKKVEFDSLDGYEKKKFSFVAKVNSEKVEIVASSKRAGTIVKEVKLLNK